MKKWCIGLIVGATLMTTSNVMAHTVTIEAVESEAIEDINELYELIKSGEEVDPIILEDAVKVDDSGYRDIDGDGYIDYDLLVKMKEGEIITEYTLLSSLLEKCGKFGMVPADAKIPVVYSPYVKVDGIAKTIKAEQIGAAFVTVNIPSAKLVLNVEIAVTGEDGRVVWTIDDLPDVEDNRQFIEEKDLSNSPYETIEEPREQAANINESPDDQIEQVSDRQDDQQDSEQKDSEQQDSEQPTVTDDEKTVVEQDTEQTTKEKKGTGDRNIEYPEEESYPDAFKDIDHRPWAKFAINKMAYNGVLSGIGNGLFEPDKYCKRCDFIIAAVKLAKMNAIEMSELNFKDVKQDKYYYKYLQIAVDNKVIANADNFRPESNITREEAAVVIYNVLRATNIAETVTETDSLLDNSYTDVSKMDNNYKVAIATLTKMGIMSGTGDKEFEPKKLITRAQMAVLLNNVYDLY